MSRYIVKIMYLNLSKQYTIRNSKNYIFKFAKTTYNLEWREYKQLFSLDYSKHHRQGESWSYIVWVHVLLISYKYEINVDILIALQHM